MTADNRSTSRSGLPDIERLLDNAAAAAQCEDLCRTEVGTDTVLREAVRLNVVEPLLKAMSLPSETAATSLPSAEGRGQLWEVAEKCAEICGYAANEFYDRFPAYAAGASQCETRIRAYAATLKGKP